MAQKGNDCTHYEYNVNQSITPQEIYSQFGFSNSGSTFGVLYNGAKVDPTATFASLGGKARGSLSLTVMIS